MRCKTTGCGSYAINHNSHGRDGSDGNLCDVCYWRKRAGALPVVEKPAMKKNDDHLTPWFPADIKPVRVGMYRVQDTTMRCGCCWIEAKWDGADWHTDLFTRGVFNTLLFHSNVKRWRGLTSAHKK